ncbi:MAG: FdhF/YdeP family oxidoreductase [Planctomycetes bacterium]|nr:FdhF/YdeP family oxidoreductase [Planctomycetota bacterium]
MADPQEVPAPTGATPGGMDTILNVTAAMLAQGPRAVIEQVKVLRSGGVCTGCSLGMCGTKDELGEFHLCYQGLRRLGESAFPPIVSKELAHMDRLRRMSSAELSRLGRVVYPMIAEEGSQGFEIVSWEQALDLIAAALARTAPEQVSFYVSGRSSNESIYVAQLFARMLGTNNVDNCSRYCHAPSTYGLSEVFGTGSGTASLEDLDAADLIFLIGSNAPGQHPRVLSNLARARARGAAIVVVNPIVERGLVRYSIPSSLKSILFGSRIASHYVRVKVGGDIAFMQGIVKWLAENNGLDRDFLHQRAEGWAALESAVRATPWEALVESSGVAREQISAVGRLYASASRALAMYCMGITHHTYGTENVKMVCNLMLARGNVGKPGAGVIPIRGHSNVQGSGSMLMYPAVKEEMIRRLESRYGVTLSKAPGLKAPEMIERGARGLTRLLYMIGGNLVDASPDTSFTEAAMRRVPILVAQTVHLNRSMLLGNKMTVVLPAQPRHEQEGGGSTESNWRQVRFSPQVLPPKGAARPEWWIFVQLAERLAKLGVRGEWLSKLSFTGVADIQREIAAVIPGYEGLPGLKPGETLRVGGRSLHEGGRFPRAGGKARVFAVRLPDNAVPPGKFALITVRADGQFNTEVWNDRDKLRGTKRRDVVHLSPADAARLGVAEGAAVIVRSSAGQARVVAHLADIREGVCAMYFPEANRLVPFSGGDESTATPNFKGTVVEIEPATARRALATAPGVESA